MLLIRRINYYVIILLFFISGCNSHSNDTYQDYHDSLIYDEEIYDEDFGFLGYISCVDNHNVVQYKLPCYKRFPNQNKYDSILIEITGFAEWKTANDQIFFLQKSEGCTTIDLFCYKGKEWDTVFNYFYVDEEQDIVTKRSLDAIYERAYTYMKHGAFYLYSGQDDNKKISLQNIEDLDLHYKEPGIAVTEYKYKIRLTQ